MSQLRPNWTSIIRLGPLSVPVSAYTTLDSKRSRIPLKQLHDGCHARVRNKPHCPVHGELNRKEVVMHYGHGPNQYVAITPKELIQLRPDADRAINVVRFVARGTMDPIRFAGTHYFLLPSNPVAQRPYAILHQAMLDERVSGIAQAVISQHDRLVMLRAVKRLLIVSVLRFAEAVRPVAAFDPNLGSTTPISDRDLSAVKSLIAQKRDDCPHLEEFHDPHLERLTELIGAKMAEGSVVA